MNPSSETETRGWTKIIVPKPRLLDISWRELWAYRDLIYLFFKRDFVTSYKQTVLGPFWFFAQPIFTSLVFWIVFGRIGKIVTKGVPQFLFFMAGIIIWHFFSNCLTRTALSLSTNAAMFGKVYFPRLTVPLSIAMTNALTFLVQFVLFLAMFVVAWYLGVPVHPNWRVILLPFLVLQIAALALGLGLIVASLTTRFRDLTLGVQFGVQLGMFVSCVVFPLAAIGKETRIWFVLNPMVPIIESFRYAFIGYGVIELWQLAMSVGMTAVIFVTGLLMFRRVESTFLDTI